MKQIVFFDGVCNLCNGWIDFLAPRLRKPEPGQSIHFASLQGKTAQAYHVNQQLTSIVLVREVKGVKTVFTETEAIFEILKSLQMPWPLFTTLKIFPRNFRNRVYRFVAGNRYRWFGKRAECRLPTEADRKRFGDLFLE